MAIAYRAGSWAGLSLLCASAVGLTFLIIGLELRRRMEPRYVAAALIAFFILLNPSILARPHLLAWPLTAFWTVVMMRARERHRAPHIGWALLVLLWANLHGSFVFGLLIAGAFALDALIEEGDRRGTLIGWGAFGSASLLLSLATPSGFHGLLFPFQVTSMDTLPLISEWRPSSLTKDPIFFAITAGVGALLLAKRARIPIARLTLLIALFVLALAHARHQALFALVGTLVAGSLLAARKEGTPEADSARRNFPWLTVCIAVILIGAARAAVPIPHSDSGTNPGQAIVHVPQELRQQPVFNGYNFGGALILNGVAPFIDGRADMYGDSFVAQAKRIENGDVVTFEAVVRRWGIRWTILSPDTPLVSWLDHQPGWRRLYADKWAVVHVASQSPV